MWPEIIKASAYLVNRTPSKHLDWKSPIERLQISLGRTIIKPDIGHLKVYGCKTYVYIPEEIRERERHHKLAPRAKIGYLVGYQSTNIYRIWFPQQEEVRPEKNVAFNEAAFFDPQEFGEPEEEDIIVTMEIPTLPTTPPGGFISEDLEEDWGIRDSADPEALPSPPPPPPPPPSSSEPQKALPALPAPAPGLPTPRATESPVPAPAAEPAPEPAVGPSAPSREIRGDVGDANIIEGRRARKPTEKASQSQAAIAFQQAFSTGAFHQDPQLHRDRLPPPPRFWHGLLRHPHREGFIKAAQTEFQALGRKETFEIVEKSHVAAASGVLPLTLIFEYKLDHNGYLARYKAQICVRGDLQPMSEQETYAAVWQNQWLELPILADML